MKSLQNIICNRKFRYSFLLLILLFLYIFVCAFSYVNAVSSDIANSVFRLHVIANSDEKEDQELKLKVRDSVLSYMNEICENVTTKEEAILIANEHIDEFKEIALNTIHENGYDYLVNIRIGNFSFPTKTYGDISLPSGYYDALRIEIGEAKGQNWWCVMFPPLCLLEAEENQLDDIEYKSFVKTMVNKYLE